LKRGHAVHFRCGYVDVRDLCVDVMAKMRGMDEFDVLWERRTTFEIGEDENYDVLSVPDLIRAKACLRRSAS